MILRLFLLVVLQFSVIHLLAQEKLKIEYEVVPYYESLDKEAFDVIMIPSFFELISDKNESLYSNIPKINNAQIEVLSVVSAFMSAETNPVYKNTESQTYIEEAIMGEKTFLIKDNLPKIDWEISKESKEIAGFPVQKATAILEGEYKTKVEAWYAPKLTNKTGPDKFWGLPGMILEVETQINYDDGSKEGTKYSATKVEVLNSDQQIKAPTKGKEITEKEFNKLVKAYLEKQMEMYNGDVDKD